MIHPVTPISCFDFSRKSTSSSPSNFFLGSALRYCSNTICLIWIRCYYGAPFSQDEKNQIKLCGRATPTGEQTPAIIEEILLKPVLLNRKLQRESTRYSKESSISGTADSDYINGLKNLKTLSYAIVKLQDCQSLLNKKLSIIENCQNIDRLPNEAKFTKSELYVLYNAAKAYEVYLDVDLKSEKLNTYFQSLFFERAHLLIEDCWKSLDVRDNKTLLFFIENEYVKATRKRFPLFSRVRELVRRGKAVHVALLKQPKKGVPKQVHITVKYYEQNNLRFIDLLSSEFLSINLTHLLSEEGKRAVQKICPASNPEQFLTEKWGKNLNEFLTDSQPLSKLENAFLYRAMSVLKWFGIPFKKKECDFQGQSRMICSEFVIYLMKRVLNDVEKSVIADYQNKTGLKLIPGSVFNNPFSKLKAYNMTPGDVQVFISQLNHLKKSGSTFIDKILLKD